MIHVSLLQVLIYFLAIYHKRSLNRDARRRELQKITIENQDILKRLQKKTATYSVEKWEEEFRKQNRYKEQISESPYEYGANQSTLLERNRLSTAQTLTGQRNTLSHSIDTGSRLNDKVVLPRISTGQNVRTSIAS